MYENFELHEVSWRAAQRELRLIRETVFIIEQRVPAELEWDGLDADARHVLARSRGGKAVGTARLLVQGQIGRMAVLKEWRGRGVGGALLEALLKIAGAAGLREVFLHAQTHALEFYARRGFRAVGAEFMDAGIPHVKMIMRLV
ncbi:MAG: GNAT family N-acetyltransferase [Burkholderiales bacterium]